MIMHDCVELHAWHGMLKAYRWICMCMCLNVAIVWVETVLYILGVCMGGYIGCYHGIRHKLA